KSFIEESGLKAYIVRRNKGNDDFIGDITDTFRKAKENTPCVIFLDDMDKFANEDSDHRDAEEYVAVQSGIDEVKNCDVFILATANEMWKLPRSLVRSGRFDRKIEVQCPTNKDADEIIEHYLSNKKVSETVNMDDLSKMISYSSCAELETILNEAAISAAYKRKPSIEMDDLVKSVLRMQYDSPDNYTKTSAEDMKKTALHEAGHLVVSEVLCPGSVGLASLRSTGRDSTGGFIHRCKELSRRPYHVLVSLAGKAAVELYYSDTCASGCQNDINRAFNIIREGLSENATLGFGMIDVATNRFPDTSENMNSRNEAVTQAELERYMLITKDILLKNREFLEKATAALIEKETLLHSDISILRNNTTITEVAV
ncbi:MAG TPA: AAA family ATPase, partial [Candidatus Aphodoplasma excrementigallinarum]|nr:AAA family ATPase [Candidatus Aphodoplasma excrementigallinarum]